MQLKFPIKSQKQKFLPKFLLLFGLGELGVLALLPITISLINQQLVLSPQYTLPVPLLAVLSLIQPTILLAIAVAIGIPLSAKLGLRSHLIEKFSQGVPFLAAIKPELKLAIVSGALVSLISILFDIFFQAWIPQNLLLITSRTVITTLVGVLYGGITEELLIRWGIMSLLSWVMWRLLQNGRGRPQARIMWAAIAISSLVFGLAHLPITAAIASLTPFLIMRGLILNGIAGIVFGWFYWRRSLEAAMIAHAMFHVTTSLITWLINIDL